MGFGVDTRDVALITEGAAALQEPMVAWLIHACCCPEVFITELIVDDELEAVPSDCSIDRIRKNNNEKESSVTTVTAM